MTMLEQLKPGVEMHFWPGRGASVELSSPNPAFRRLSSTRFLHRLSRPPGVLRPAMDFTRDLRSAASRRVRETSRPAFGHGWPFLLTQNWRLRVKGTWASWLLRF